MKLVKVNEYNAKKLFHTLKDIFISSPYGNRINPITGKSEFHEGVDYSANGNSIPIYALDDGEVLYEGFDNSTGAIICYIRFPKLDDYVGLYYHLANAVINKGDKVTKDTKIGMMGMTGYATGNHLHFNWFPYSDYKKGFYDRKYEDFNKYVFPENRVKVTPPVDRNENASQIKVIVDELRVRTSHSVNGQVIGFVQNKGIYNDLEAYKDKDYTWHRIADNQWIADTGEWLELYPRKETEVERLTRELKEANKKLEEQKEINTKLQEENLKLKDNVSQYETKLKEINKISTL